MSSLDDRKRAAQPVVVYAPYGAFEQPKIKPFREGQTLYEIMLGMECLPADFKDRGIIQINGHEIVRGAWHLVRPKPSISTRPICVTFHLPPRGGKKGGGGKAIIGIVALLALTVLTAGIAGGALAGLGGTMPGWFLAGSISAKVLAGAVGLIGALAVSALTRPPKKADRSDNTEAPEAASAEGNVIEPNGGVPRVIGTRKVFPPMAFEPFVELIDDEDEYVHAAYVLNGPHQISDIKIGDASIDDDENVQYQVREGWQSDDLISLVTRYGRTLSASTELSNHVVQSDQQHVLKNQRRPDLSCPKWHRFASKDSPDEIWLQFMYPGGFAYTPDPNGTPLGMPVRIRIRKEGDTSWINLPEIHIQGRSMKAFKWQVLIKWDVANKPSAQDVRMGYGQGIIHVVARMPAQNVLTPVDPGSYQWQAHSHFWSSGGDFMSANAVGNLQNVYVDSNEHNDAGVWTPNGDANLFGTGSTIWNSTPKNTLHVFLDSGTFPKGVYEIEVMRGEAYAYSTLVTASWTYNSYVRNFFRYYNDGTNNRLQGTQNNVVTALALTRIVSIWNDHPIPQSGFATIAVRAKNKQMQGVSCIAGGYVSDWDGSGWNTVTVTSNPAPHFRDILTGRLNFDPLPESLIDDTKLVEWRSHCTDNNYTCDFICEGQRIEEALSIVASCGYARPYWSDGWGVVIDYDRSAESPVQVFTGHNSRGFKFRKALARLPDGLRITYRSDADQYAQRQVNVYRNDVQQSDQARIEQVSYEGLVDSAKIEQRGRFDLRQGEYRSTFYALEAPFEWIVCRRGSLVAVQNDILTHHSASARIKTVNESGGNVISIVLNTEVDVLNDADMLTTTNILAVADMLSVMKMGVLIRRTDGSLSTHALSNASGRTDTLVFATPFPVDSWTGGVYDSGSVKDVTPGCLVAIGPVSQEYLRLIVTEILPGKDGTAQITMVDEAPELWAA